MIPGGGRVQGKNQKIFVNSLALKKPNKHQDSHDCTVDIACSNSTNSPFSHKDVPWPFCMLVMSIFAPSIWETWEMKHVKRSKFVTKNIDDPRAFGYVRIILREGRSRKEGGKAGNMNYIDV